MPTRSPGPFHAVVAGAGPAAIETVLALNALAGLRVDVTLVAPDDAFVLRPVSVAEPFALTATRRYPLDEVLPARVRRFHAGLASADPTRREITLDTGRRLAYDALVVAAGATARPVPDALTFRGPGDAGAMRALVNDLEDGHAERIAFVAPPGARWTLPLYELALQTGARAEHLGLDGVVITVKTWEERPLEAFGPSASELVDELLRAARIELVSGATATDGGSGVAARPGAEPRRFERVVALPTLDGRRVPGLPSDAGGFIPVDAEGAVPGCPGVYAAGDGTDFPIKQGGIATQLADTVASAIARRAGADCEPQEFRPVLRAMLFTGAAPWFLRRDVRRASDAEVSRAPLWWPPAKVAGHHLAPRLDELDGMAQIEGAPAPVERRYLARGGDVRRRAMIAPVEGEPSITMLERPVSSPE